MLLLLIPLMIGTTEILLLAGAALLLFGGKKLPEMMRNMGKGVKEFKDGVQGASKEFEAGMTEENNTIEEPAINNESSEDNITNNEK